MINNDKATFIAGLWRFVNHDGEQTPDGYGRPSRQPMRGQTILAGGLCACLLEDTPDPTDYDGASWLYYLDHYLVDAFAAMRMRPDFADLRTAYAAEADGLDVPDLVERHGTMHAALHRLIVAQGIVDLCVTIAADTGRTVPVGDAGGGGATKPEMRDMGWLRAKLERTFFAQDDAVDSAWLSFVRVAYRQIMPRIAGEQHRMNRGTFGETTLTTFDCADRVTFSFQRGDDCATWAADASDMHGRRSGPNTTETRYDRVVSMIGEVTRLWSLDDMKEVRP